MWLLLLFLKYKISHRHGARRGGQGSSKPPTRAPYHNCVLPPLATRGQCTAAGLKKKKKKSHMLVNIFLGSIRCNEKVRDFQIRHVHTHAGVLPNESSRGSRLASSAACTRGRHSSFPNTTLADRLWLGPGRRTRRKVMMAKTSCRHVKAPTILHGYFRISTKEQVSSRLDPNSLSSSSVREKSLSV